MLCRSAVMLFCSSLPNMGESPVIPSIAVLEPSCMLPNFFLAFLDQSPSYLRERDPPHWNVWPPPSLVAHTLCLTDDFVLSDFLRKINNIQLLTDQTCPLLLFCMEVNKLYPSVPKQEGLAACKKALDSRQNPRIPTVDVMAMNYDWIGLRY